ncbi:hypothetical protein [Eubacterium sp. 1001713B170207_170306_E7]|uniref:hypothetical protein n=1 Tax=Eubacterium sp. 1001713B170207_170306_E7 TaxID=2787097 RepID=UPI00189C345F|nr:hypothetical protein [Eubacterium sp. 1001713B170207_170306_E7]
MKAKRILTFAIAALMVFSLTACAKKNAPAQTGDTPGMEVTADPSTPEGTVKIVFDAFKDKDAKTLNENIKISLGGEFGALSGLTSNDNQLLTDAQDPESQELLTNLTEDFSYKILESQTNGDQATVKVQVTNRDLSQVINKLIGEDPSEDRFLNLVKEAKGKTVTNELDLPVVKENGKWMVNMDTGAVNAVFGNIMSADIMNAIKDSLKSQQN